MADNSQGLDSVLQKLYRIASNTEAHSDSPNYNFNGVDDAKQAILQWVNDEVIGKQVEPDIDKRIGSKDGKWIYERSVYSLRASTLNQRLSEQRNILKAHGYKGEEEV